MFAAVLQHGFPCVFWNLCGPSGFALRFGPNFRVVGVRAFCLVTLYPQCIYIYIMYIYIYHIYIYIIYDIIWSYYVACGLFVWRLQDLQVTWHKRVGSSAIADRGRRFDAAQPVATNSNWIQMPRSVCLKIGYIPNYSHLIGIMIINHWVWGYTIFRHTQKFLGDSEIRTTHNFTTLERADS